jgi:hypothetical protein
MYVKFSVIYFRSNMFHTRKDVISSDFLQCLKEDPIFFTQARVVFLYSFCEDARM